MCLKSKIHHASQWMHNPRNHTWSPPSRSTVPIGGPHRTGPPSRTCTLSVRGQAIRCGWTGWVRVVRLRQRRDVCVDDGGETDAWTTCDPPPKRITIAITVRSAVIIGTRVECVAVVFALIGDRSLCGFVPYADGVNGVFLRRGMPPN